MKIEQSKLRRIIEIAAIILLSGVVFFACNAGKKSEEIVETALIEDSERPSEAEKPSAEPVETPKTVFVYVCGAVVKPGVYELPADARKMDALNAAGGFTEDAVEDAVNLAAFLEDADMLRIPHIGEEVPAEDVSADGAKAKININTADVKELTSLPGIGESKAEAIVKYRQKAGRFARTEDLMNVPGIKEGTFEGIRDLIKAE